MRLGRSINVEKSTEANRREGDFERLKDEKEIENAQGVEWRWKRHVWKQ